ncbi:acetate/propionate family kinase [Pseudotabrizicola algicola]|uniref:Acetate kinase n=1 Tax=Pseudotabrizicola algicola TaxID=2709381 RepID=A0A6B3RKG7_9RHOB|nr:acetate kinase [Pseudotabrizicola algicola]NEX45736.1 acetate kinase [Pseudotabrizicola algicola]
MLLVVNSGSSSLKLAVFAGLDLQAQAHVDRIGSGGPPDHAQALRQGLAQLNLSGGAVKGAAHRVVHGGASLTRTCRLTPRVRQTIHDCAGLAPLHNPPALAGIDAVADLWPDLPQFAAFDTAFHAGNPEVATTYALPLAERERGLRRYGFHGLSYAAIVRKVQEMTGSRLPERMLSFHLGNGASACAIEKGRSVASSMGFSPLDGLTMGTRPGGLDPAVVLYLVACHGPEATGQMLNRASGLVALGGSNDMRALHAAGTQEAGFAIAHFCYWAARHGASLCAAMGGLDAITFTGGIGENDAIIRAGIVKHLAFLGPVLDGEANARGERALHKPTSKVAIWIVPADEERQIAIEVAACQTEEEGQR